jgi:hypothetical protein
MSVLMHLRELCISFQVRDLQKKMQHVENELDNTLEKLGGTNVKLDEKVKLVS